MRNMKTFFSTSTQPRRRGAKPSALRKPLDESPTITPNQNFYNDNDNKTSAAAINKLLGRYIKKDKKKFVTPGAAIMVIKEGQVVYKTYQGAAKGIARGEENEYAEINENTIFELASVSKQFTAMAIILLRDRAKKGEVKYRLTLDYDDPLSKFFPSDSFNVCFKAEVARKVTVRHLLNHTSGLKDITELFQKRKYIDPPVDSHYPRSPKAVKGENPFMPTSRQALELLSKQDLTFEPGSKWEYSNSGYIILAQIVESVTGERFPDFMRENIFKPLGMDNTFIKDENEIEPPPNRVSGYDRGWADFHNTDYTPFNRIYGDGNVHTTLRDMKEWDHAFQVIYKNEDVPGTPLAQEQSIRDAFGPKIKTDDLPSAISYSSGWFFGYYRGGHGRQIPLMWHGGSWYGMRTMILRFYPEPQLTVIVLANNMHLPATTVACRIAKVFLDEQPKNGLNPLSTERLREVVAQYHQIVDNKTVVNGDDIAYSDDITLEDGELWVRDGYGEKYKLTYSERVSAAMNDDARRTTGVEPTDDKEAFVFYSQDLDDNDLEGFDVFRYDIVGNNIHPRPAARAKRPSPTYQKR